ncbi:MAG: ATP-binding protein [Fimbriimonadales bacterium]|nr:ATP-binding protein [Fimbriimonadales bacterium]
MPDWEEMPVDIARFIAQQSAQTIKCPLDAIVELVTNSDDEFRRSGREGGEIVLHYVRDGDGNCREIRVLDNAGGMTRDQLDVATTFGRESSHFKTTKGVRGFFGRGLKEALIALGEGDIITRKHDQVLRTSIKQDSQDIAPKRLVPEEVSLNEAASLGLTFDGTLVVIRTLDRAGAKRIVPEPDKFLNLTANHYALRDIWERRTGRLTYKSERRTGRDRKTLTVIKSNQPVAIRPEKPLMEKCAEERIHLQASKFIDIAIYESKNQLTGKGDEPDSYAGIVIKSEGVPLEKRAFLEARPGSCYFSGIVEAPFIAKNLRNDDSSMLQANRSGLDWRTTSCRELAVTIEKTLAPLITEKEAQLAGSKIDRDPDRTSKLKRDAEFLNRLAKQLGAQLQPGLEGGTDLEPVPLADLAIRPLFCNMPPGAQRKFKIYCPISNLPSNTKIEQGFVVLTGVDGEASAHLPSVDDEVTLTRDPVRRDILSGNVTVVVPNEAQLGSYWILSAVSESSRAVAEIVCAEPGKSNRNKDPGSPRGGIFERIEPDLSPDPTQRVWYDPGTRVLRIYVEFPTLKRTLGYPDAWLTSEAAKTLYVELLAEGLCRTVVLRDIERGALEYGDTPEAAAASSFAHIDKLRRKCVKEIYDYVTRQYGT